MQAKREQWSGFSKTTQASRLVFQAESGVNINMARRYGQGKGGAAGGRLARKFSVKAPIRACSHKPKRASIRPILPSAALKIFDVRH